MDWLERMNRALAYLEDNLAGEIAYPQAARLACLSPYHFGRMFSFLAEVPVSDYVRRRRLTQAAFDLQNGDKVLEVALRYGYDSPTAFTRAFRALHGAAPSDAKKGATLKAFPRISFQITIKGVAEMEYRIEEKPAFRIVGVREPVKIGLENAEESFARIPKFWQEMGAGGQIARVWALADSEPHGMLGLCTCYSNAENHYYIAAASTQPVPDGMYEDTIPAATYAIFPGCGGPESIQVLQKRIFSEWLPASGYEWAEAPDVEVYLDDSPTDMHYEVWLPVTRKA